MNKKIIYLDYAATTPPAPEVVEQMTLGLSQIWGNASSEHILGHAAHRHIDEALSVVAKFLNVEQSTLTLTSGATESINLALKGVMRAQRKKHIIAITTEHKATLNTVQALVKEGYQATFLAPNEAGQITKEMVEAAIHEETAIITSLWVNNETGEIYDIEGFSEVARRHKVLLHVDATQAMPHFKPDFSWVDLASFTAHKIYGPKGIGVLYQRDFPKIPMVAVIDGAKTELGHHVGTLANHQIMGLARAVQLLPGHYATEHQHSEQRLAALLDHLAPYGVTRNGKEAKLTPAIINLHVPNIYGETLMAAVSQLCFSRGSACNSDETLPSHVLTELGYDTKHARESVRISLGRYLLAFDFQRALNDLGTAIAQLQHIAKGERCATVLPVVHQKGSDIHLKLLHPQDFTPTHSFDLDRNDVVIGLDLKHDGSKVTHLSIKLQATPFILWFINEAAAHLRGNDVSAWENFRMTDVMETKNAPQNELRLVMVIETFIRESGQSLSA
ncbi:cysteine desulfurase family protein [Wohlfahrtiimonas chitiniclastica]|uniref:cysteine desulfurase family protein n=1 Tax=Wohlfahrtiimonas chitiniclastica TaxID=400946 RepID=UPI000B97ED0B|nr:cysteine desulfurase family protein [Wohlfahrtiimonas chitiniclastica]OYQ85553.1 cysteine desulfurase [Wohlfahrtiimonas chitiniclastica]OYQ86211.1 cysteine desulfurase [Wohlfahrtiimonas chitiniclastica]